MALHEFKYYLHDDYNSCEMADYLKDKIPALADKADEEIAELVGRPFYEVTLHCILNDETGEVTLIKAEL